jgi:hypothetical protein
VIDYDARRAEVLRRAQREDRRFHIIMGASCGLFVLFLVAVAWLIVATEPQRRAAYLADCQTRGFTAQQCAFLYSERLRQDADSAAAIAVGAAALAVSASRR